MADDLYRVLGLEPQATTAQVERAYRFCAGLYAEGALATYSLLEPSEAEAQRQRVREAYETLADPEKRRAYDLSLGYQPPEAPVIPFPSPSPRAAGAAGARELPRVVSGPQLRELREARGLSLRHIAAVTKIGTRFLEYIEEDRFAFLPPAVYLRGFLQEYAKVLGLEPRPLADSYMARLPKA